MRNVHWIGAGIAGPLYIESGLRIPEVFFPPNLAEEIKRVPRVRSMARTWPNLEPYSNSIYPQVVTASRTEWNSITVVTWLLRLQLMTIAHHHVMCWARAWARPDGGRAQGRAQNLEGPATRAWAWALRMPSLHRESWGANFVSMVMSNIPVKGENFRNKWNFSHPCDQGWVPGAEDSVQLMDFPSHQTTSRSL